VDKFLLSRCLPVGALSDDHQLVTASIRRFAEATACLVREKLNHIKLFDVINRIH
jgi:hypothetical protein